MLSGDSLILGVQLTIKIYALKGLITEGDG